MRKQVRLVLLLGMSAVVVLVGIRILQKIITSKQNDLIKLEPGSSGKLFTQPKLDEIARKKAGLSGPFPIDDNIAEQERNIGLLMNAWREAIVLKSIKEIERLSIEIERYNKESIPFLRKLALEDENERIRAFSTRSLGRMRNAELVPLFIGLLKNDTSPFVRENAAWSLGLLGDSKSLDSLQLIADNDSSDRVRQSARKAISSIQEANKNRKEK